MSKTTMTAAGVAAAAGLTAALIAASPSVAETAAPSNTASATAAPGTSPTAGASGSAEPTSGSTTRPERRQPRGTVVTGDEAAKVIAAVTAKHPALTDASVHKHDDGTYRVSGTLDGAKVAYHVSADLATVTEHTRGSRDGSGGPKGTVVTGDEAAKVIAAVTSKHPALTDASVHKHDDGTYHVSGTLDGAKVAYHVSTDLGTVTEREVKARRK